jgi:hypothetical protein
MVAKTSPPWARAEINLGLDVDVPRGSSDYRRLGPFDRLAQDYHRR